MVRLKHSLELANLDLYRTQQQDPRLANIPVILATGHDPTLLQNPRNLPPILNKPFRAQQLLDQVADRLAPENLCAAP